jgi:hypothetical protein
MVVLLRQSQIITAERSEEVVCDDASLEGLRAGIHPESSLSTAGCDGFEVDSATALARSGSVDAIHDFVAWLASLTARNATTVASSSRKSPSSGKNFDFRAAVRPPTKLPAT